MTPGLSHITRHDLPTLKTLVFIVLPKLALLLLFLQQSNRGVLYRFDLYLERGEVWGVVLFLIIWACALLAIVVVAFLPRLSWRIFWALIICSSAVAGKFYGQIMTAGHFAINWLLNNKLVTSALAGPRTLEQWQDYLAALEHEFTAEDEALVDELVVTGHPSTPGYNDPAYPIEGRVPHSG